MNLFDTTAITTTPYKEYGVRSKVYSYDDPCVAIFHAYRDEGPNPEWNSRVFHDFAERYPDLNDAVYSLVIHVGLYLKKDEFFDSRDYAKSCVRLYSELKKFIDHTSDGERKRMQDLMPMLTIALAYFSNTMDEYLKDPKYSEGLEKAISERTKNA